MAKKTRNIIKNAAANVRQTERALAAARGRDFRRASTVQDAIFGNLSRYNAGRRQDLTRSNARTLRKVERLVERMELAGRRTSQREQEAARMYGSGLSQVAADAFLPAGVAAGNILRESQQSGRLAAFGAQTGSQVVNIAEAGAAEARAGADAALAEALQGRAQADANMVAQMEHEVTMAQLQAKLQMDQFKQQLVLEQKAAQGLLGKTFKDRKMEAENLGADMAQASKVIREMFANWDEDTDGPLTAPIVIQEMVNRGILMSPEDPGAGIITQLFAAIQNGKLYGEGSNREGMVQAIMDTVSRNYDWANKPKRYKALEKYVRLTLADLYVKGGEEPEDSDGFLASLFDTIKEGPSGFAKALGWPGA